MPHSSLSRGFKGKVTRANESVARAIFVFAVSKPVSDEVEQDRCDASINDVLEQDILCVLHSDRSNAQLQYTRA